MEALLASLVGDLLMRIVLFLVIVALLLGPLRRPLLKPLFITHARFTIPAIAGGVVGLLLGCYVATMAGLPPALVGLLSLAAASALALSAGQGSKDWFDQTFGKKGGPPTP